ncbi:PCI domain-containing protein [Coprinopsis cinerea okayama7|uniref:Eukaryotic translation initiation factor 3 subunit M n=1 Tax=Coprinopsis cinerea (strain Okayama-7 / 130 / ATCC MYA-4618 / FGSC 9003) TaxID=240176 RepID=A8NYU3_COPC7|nr:PCI domain-containing protein [Coprinopsis cinerea okayama7\|eukprot:XP_001837524.1 PCI domain-containing protein [Coprinopsis cinerea okayama7\
MASQTDSVSIFAEGTFEEQILELVNYLARTRSEEERPAFVAPFENGLKTEEGQKPVSEDPERQKAVLKDVLQQVQGLGDGSEKEVEGFFNLLYAHLLSIYPPGSPELREILANLLQSISSSPSDQLPIKYRVLSNLFNSLPRNSPLRSLVYTTILQIAVEKDDLRSLQLTKSEVQKWISEWDLSDEQKAEFLKQVADAFAKTGQLAQSYEYSLLYIQKLPSTSDAAREAAVTALSNALRLPDVFDFDPLFKLDAVIAVKDHELFSLLQVFINNGLAEFKAWEASHPGSLEKHGLDRAVLEHKIRLLTLASLAVQHVGQHLPYAKIAEGLEVDVSEVEKWVIDVIRAGLVWGKLSQNTQNLHVTRATSRSFEKEQWATLEKRLQAWKSGLTGVLEVVSNAKRMGGHPSAVQPQAAA